MCKFVCVCLCVCVESLWMSCSGRNFVVVGSPPPPQIHTYRCRRNKNRMVTVWAQKTNMISVRGIYIPFVPRYEIYDRGARGKEEGDVL